MTSKKRQNGGNSSPSSDKKYTFEEARKEAYRLAFAQKNTWPTMSHSVPEIVVKTKNLYYNIIPNEKYQTNWYNDDFMKTLRDLAAPDFLGVILVEMIHRYLKSHPLDAHVSPSKPASPRPGSPVPPEENIQKFINALIKKFIGKKRQIIGRETIVHNDSFSDNQWQYIIDFDNNTFRVKGFYEPARNSYVDKVYPLDKIHNNKKWKNIEEKWKEASLALKKKLPTETLLEIEKYLKSWLVDKDWTITLKTKPEWNQSKIPRDDIDPNPTVTGSLRNKSMLKPRGNFYNLNNPQKKINFQSVGYSGIRLPSRQELIDWEENRGNRWID